MVSVDLRCTLNLVVTMRTSLLFHCWLFPCLILNFNQTPSATIAPTVMRTRQRVVVPNGCGWTTRSRPSRWKCWTKPTTATRNRRWNLCWPCRSSWTNRPRWSPPGSAAGPCLSSWNSPLFLLKTNEKNRNSPPPTTIRSLLNQAIFLPFLQVSF